jgi:outer membrane protein OmpA-like peptidoglycan-associated protein
MKNTVLLLSVLIALSIFAVGQQGDASSSSAAAQSSATGSSGSDLQPIPSPDTKDFWDGDDPSFGSLITHPFASKKYVRRHTEPIRDRLNELEQLTSETGGMVKDVDARAQKGIQLASEKSNVADQHASDASSKAQLAQTSASMASTRVAAEEQTVANIDQYKGSAQTEIHFRSGQSVLSKDAKDALDQMAAPLKDQHGYIVEVRGFSAGHGQAATAASQRMADSVVRYLVLSQQIPVYRIYVMSMGNAAAASAGKHVSGGRVEVSVLKNDLVSSAKQ